MGFTYDIITAKSDKKSAIGIYICHIIDNLIELFLSTFLIAHIYSYSTDIYDYLLKVSIYEGVSWAVMLVVYAIASKLVDTTNRVGVYRFSMLIWIVLTGFMIFFGNEIASLLWLAGILLGLAKGFYWSSYHVLRQEMIGKSSMGKFATHSKVYQQLVSVLFPITLGAIIDKASFCIAAILVLVFCVIQICCSFLIKSQRPTDSKFSPIAFLKSLKEDNKLNKRLKFFYGMTFVFATNNIVATLVNVYTMIMFGSNFSLGMITSFIAIAVIIMTLIIGRFSKPGKRDALLIVSTVLSILSIIIFIAAPQKSTLIIFNFVLSIFGVIFKLIFDIYRSKFLKEFGRYDDIAEHQWVIESILQFVRAIVCGIVIVVALLKSFVLVQVMIVLFGLLYALNFILILIFDRKFMKENETQKVDA